MLVFDTTGRGAPFRSRWCCSIPRACRFLCQRRCLVAAKDEPDGPGHLLESRVRFDGQFKLDQDERIADRESERHVLWYVMENLLSRDLALRERITGDDYVVFPPAMHGGNSGSRHGPLFGVAFRFAGPVRSIPATLIAAARARLPGIEKARVLPRRRFLPPGGGRPLPRPSPRPRAR